VRGSSPLRKPKMIIGADGPQANFHRLSRRQEKPGKERNSSDIAVVCEATPSKMVFILAETAAGYAIFKAKDKALKNRKTLADNLGSVENATSMYLQQKDELIM